ncbi:hypothetical protein [Cohnella pontilimi]|nr:hypothetical protein [Cohnella pontilimi]
MTGRNNKPDNDGPAATPSRLDQFGGKLAEDTGSKPMNRKPVQGQDRC